MPFIQAPGALVHFKDFDLHSEMLHASVNDPVVLLHGAGCDWRYWSRQLGWLAHNRRVVAVDIRGGAGRTRWNRLGWMTEDLAADLYAVVSELGLRRPAVVGASAGGTVALQYALDHPTELSRLLLVGSLPGVPEEFEEFRDEQLAFIKTHTMREIAEKRMAFAFSAQADPVIKAFMIEMIASGDLEGYRSGADALAAFDVRDRLGEIAVPTTIIHGELDAPIPSAIAPVMAKGIPGATLHIVDGQGHFFMLEAPEVFDPLLADALAIPGEQVPAR